MRNFDLRMKRIEAQLRPASKVPPVLTFAHPTLPADGKSIFNTEEELLACYPTQFKNVVVGFHPQEWVIAAAARDAKEKGNQE
jgi:hypothetical protein